MFIKQVSVFVENKSGKIADILSVLGENSIDISALSIADTTDFGIIRMIVNDTEKALSVLKSYGAIAKITDVIGVRVSDTPGGLATALCALKKSGIELDYIYAFVGRDEGGATVVMKVDNPEAALSCLKDNNISVIEG